MVDFFLLIQLAGTGDELQGIKRGIMEMADGIVINKADGDNIERAKMAAGHFRNALHLFPPAASGWFPKVLTYSGYYNLGIEEVWNMIEEYITLPASSGGVQKDIPKTPGKEDTLMRSPENVGAPSATVGPAYIRTAATSDSTSISGTKTAPPSYPRIIVPIPGQSSHFEIVTSASVQAPRKFASKALSLKNDQSIAAEKLQ